MSWPPASLLGRLRGPDADGLLRLGRPVRLPAQQRVIRQGDAAQHSLLILQGAVKVVVDTERGRDVVIAVRGRGDLLGEMATLEHRPRSAHVVTCSPVQARVIHSADLAAFLSRNAVVCLAVAQMLSERLRFADRRGIDFVVCPAPVRVVRVLLDVVQQHGSCTAAGWEVGIPLSQAEIASMAGTGLSTVEKTFRRLESAGALGRRYRRVLIIDLPGLRRFGELPGGIP
ncbi:Crp/Fnr family transcriptional regulator [Amycolatopsis sp. CA-128772]|uniref:Crp/Fnr family transcriptional regulator n=1 Tax=Amycolatopsis sp. CA-128772 TaxID=2073159 RepID=UPI000CD26892|nr:Crp/Fnr family transcriptional regulator [Amycolatopsis sp. CA-128772]